MTGCGRFLHGNKCHNTSEAKPTTLDPPNVLCSFSLIYFLHVQCILELRNEQFPLANGSAFNLMILDTNSGADSDI